MSLPDRNNPYTFESFIQTRDSFNYYNDDDFLLRAARHYCGNQFQDVDDAATATAQLASFRWKKLAHEISQPEKRLYLKHFDAFNHRVDEIVRPADSHQLQNEIYAQALFSKHTPMWVRFIKMFLIYQNGEANTACPLTCTEGLAELLEKFADTPELSAMRDHLKEGIDGHYAVGAQFVSEIQGGSDIPEVRVEAVERDGQWRLFGKKFFCSVTHADYAVVAAKPENSESVAIFAVPAYLSDDKDRGHRNGCTIDRLKWKMGTSELPTAEITYDGALAYPIGPLDRGLANVVEIVLTYSRVTIGISSAATMTRAAREARQYAQFRQAFGQPIERFPALEAQLSELDTAARRTTAGAFKVYSKFIAPQDSEAKSKELERAQFIVRELIMLQKIASSWDAVDVLRGAMSVFGGHGIMEDFSSLPRLFRDATVNELWEGPRNVLLWQIHRDLQKASTWYPATEFIADLFEGADKSLIDALGQELIGLVSGADLSAAPPSTCKQWDQFCHRLFHRWQELALAEIP